MRATDLFIWGYVAHLVADAMLQNEWMAVNKVSLKHPASWVHSGIHFAALLFVFPLWAALLLAVSHLLIDTRVPLQLWRRFYRQTSDPANPAFIAFAMWQDQSAHILALAVAAWMVAK